MAEITQRIPTPAQSTCAKSFEIENTSEGEFAATMVRKAGEYLETGDVQAAEKCLRMGLQKVPEHPRCLAYLAVCVAMGQANFDTAEKLAKKIIETNPDDATAYYALGRIDLLRDRRGPAFRNFAKAGRLAGGDLQIQGDLDRIEPRRSPVVPCLSRNHTCNIILGRLRATLGRIFHR